MKLVAASILTLLHTHTLYDLQINKFKRLLGWLLFCTAAKIGKLCNSFSQISLSWLHGFVHLSQAIFSFLVVHRTHTHTPSLQYSLFLSSYVLYVVTCISYTFQAAHSTASAASILCVCVCAFVM